MAEIAPLTPLRYDLSRLSSSRDGGLAAVVAPPYDVISPEQRAELAARDPHNVVRLILPEGEGDAKYANAADLFGRWRSEGVLVRDDQPAFYRYDQTFRAPGQPASAPPIRRRGFLALVRLAPFSDRIVLPHERTLSGPKEDRLKLFRATRANLSPGFMLYRDASNALAAPLDVATPLAEFGTPDGVTHALAKVHAPDAVRAIIEGVAKSTLLIADGHHRYETAVRYAQEASAAAGEKEADPRSRGEQRYFMTFLVNGDDPDLVVFPTHRHVHSLASFSFDDMTRLARDYFTVEALESGIGAEAILERVRLAGQRGPSLAAAAGDGRVALLTLRGDVNLDAHPTLGKKPAVLRRTDVAVLHSAILESVLGITPEAQAAKTNLWYMQDAAATLRDLRSGRGQALFLMNATPVAQVREVAEAGEVMPQKSTFFYPKVATGLAVHTLDPARKVGS
ncbi:MAG TPA: DUF1015 domain-containing protein [Polyangiaceae bacterium]|jgi:uncharacterized protein (DUF1015 family)|nr:DUF1015 domain-containing protein [Polyangiaceae bacterium]